MRAGKLNSPNKLASLLAAVAFALATPASAATTFMGLGDLPGGAFSSHAYGVSADGLTVVGLGRSASGNEAFRWTETGGMVGLGDLPGGRFASTAYGVSADGSVVVGSSRSSASGGFGPEAFRWTQAGGMQALGDLSGGVFTSLAFGVSNDGLVVVGQGNSARGSSGNGREAFRWTQAGGMVGLGDLPGGAMASVAKGVSADGLVVVGLGLSASGFEAFRLDYDNHTTLIASDGLGDLPGGSSNSDALGVSANGSVVVGHGVTADGREAFRWTQTGGMLGLIPGSVLSSASDVSRDGSVVVGDSFGIGTRAIVWDATNGVRNLQDVLIAGGSHLTGWTLFSAQAVSDDGRTIVGIGTNPAGNPEGWIAQLPALPQKIILAWEHDSPFAIENQTTAFGQLFNVNNPNGVMTAYNAAEFDPALGPAFEQFKTDILLQVQQQFADSGITNVDIVNGAPEENAAVVYLADTDFANTTGTLAGRAVSGIDRSNEKSAGEAVVFVSDDDFVDPATRDVEYVAETITHEVGHLLGLRHVDPPGALAVMDYDAQAGDIELFTNGVFNIQEPPSPLGEGEIFSATHNPIYHLKRYAEGISHADIVSQGINPGTWDEPGAILGPIIVDFSFAGASPDTTLFDVLVLEANGGGQDDVAFTQVAHFDEITLDELSNMSFQIGPLDGIGLLAASESGGPLDIALALDDPFAENALTLYPAPGDIAGFLQIASAAPAGYETLAHVTVTATVVPEPSTLVLALVALLAHGRRRRA